ncbi:MAG: TIGR03118 family protein [Pseudomonadota bacterium]
MDTRRKVVAWLNAALAGAVIAAGVASCGGSNNNGNGGGATPPAVVSRYLATSLVTDLDMPGTQTDEFIVNPWGLAFDATGYGWVANNDTSTMTLYNGNGLVQELVVTVPPGGAGDANPTGIVYNSTQDFRITLNGVSGVSKFIIAGEAGTIAGYSQTVNATEAVTVYDVGDGPVYKGLAIGRAAGANYLYAADFLNNKIDVFDRNFVLVSLVGNFRDPRLPAGYAPFGIQVAGERVYVSYARQSATAADEQVNGAGLGVVSVFNTNGTFIRQLANGGALNAPWGMAVAPVNFGSFSNHLLVANFGDGKINAYNTTNGNFVGTLGRSDGTPIVIDGLWGISFGNGSFSQPLNSLFFTAGPANETHGLYGRIDLL